MTLKEAIQHCDEQADSLPPGKCKDQHCQLASWLKELQTRRITTFISWIFIMAGTIGFVSLFQPSSSANPTKVPALTSDEVLYFGKAYLVRPGDTVYYLSYHFGVDFFDLVRLNHIQPHDDLIPGTVIKIPPKRPVINDDDNPFGEEPK